MPKVDLLHLIENTFDRKRIYANPSSCPNPNPKGQLCFRTDEMTSFFDQVYQSTPKTSFFDQVYTNVLLRYEKIVKIVERWEI